MPTVRPPGHPQELTARQQAQVAYEATAEGQADLEAQWAEMRVARQSEAAERYHASPEFDAEMTAKLGHVGYAEWRAEAAAEFEAWNAAKTRPTAAPVSTTLATRPAIAGRTISRSRERRARTCRTTSASSSGDDSGSPGDPPPPPVGGLTHQEPGRRPVISS